MLPSSINGRQFLFEIFSVRGMIIISAIASLPVKNITVTDVSCCSLLLVFLAICVQYLLCDRHSSTLETSRRFTVPNIGTLSTTRTATSAMSSFILSYCGSNPSSVSVLTMVPQRVWFDIELKFSRLYFTVLLMWRKTVRSSIRSITVFKYILPRNHCKQSAEIVKCAGEQCLILVSWWRGVLS